jgi:hypothetical protein
MKTISGIAMTPEAHHEQYCDLVKIPNVHCFAKMVE